MKNMNKLILILSSIFVVTSASVLAGVERLPEYSTVYRKNANPHEDLTKAMKRAKKKNKNILIIVGADWCKWSGTLDNLLDDHDDISKSMYETFEVVRIYYGKNMTKEAKTLLKQLPRFKGTPHFYVLDNKAKLLESLDTGTLERGYGYNRRKVSAWINKYKIETGSHMKSPQSKKDKK